MPEISSEEQRTLEAILSARTVQTFLWGEADGEWGFASWVRLIRKRIDKLDVVDLQHPHAIIEIRKRLLQLAALSIALMGVLETTPDFLLAEQKLREMEGDRP